MFYFSMRTDRYDRLVLLDFPFIAQKRDTAKMIAASKERAAKV